MNQYLLLLHEAPTDFSNLSPADLQRIVAEYGAWSQSMAERELLVDGHKLTDEGGRSLRRGEDGLEVVDGPYMETKEVIGGVFIIRARDYDHAVELCASCPHLAYGGRIELRQVDEMGAEAS